MKLACLSLLAGLGLASATGGQPSFTSPDFDAAAFALPLPEGNGLLWEDPREIHRVVVHFREPPAPESALRLEYWGSRWPQQRLPKDREPGGGDVGWMELGNWYRYGWRTADAQVDLEGTTATFTFRPVNAKEFPQEKSYNATFRYTLKLRVATDHKLPAIRRFEAFTDSRTQPHELRLAWARPSRAETRVDAFNGYVDRVERLNALTYRVQVRAAFNTDPNTFDRTLVTIRRDDQVVTFKVDALQDGPLLLPHEGLAVLRANDRRGYADVARTVRDAGGTTLYDRVAQRPEQTWEAAWSGMPPKKSHIYFPLGLDGGRQRFRLNADGSVDFRSNDHYLRQRPGRDTPRLPLEPANAGLGFGLPDRPTHRTLAEQSLPLCETTWDLGGLRLTQRALVTPLEGTQPQGALPEADVTTVFLAEFTLTNATPEAREFLLPLRFRYPGVWLDEHGLLWRDNQLRGQTAGDAQVASTGGIPALRWHVPPGGTGSAVLKLPYVLLTEKAEHQALRSLDFDRERAAAVSYWRRRLDESSRLLTPEPMLNEFYRSHAMHLLVNCEREPGETHRFARVGSFAYGAYGNESCMMVADLERRGYHREARECLEAWLRYQGTVALPGDFASREGVLYGAGGYEAGGYNQHHGWILWALAEHYRYTRDNAWLRHASPGIVAGADWIIRETDRTADRHPLERGLLPAGSLEDIGDWWTWLSTSCYMWRGLDSAAWALGQLQHPQAQRIRQAADAYHNALVGNFRAAAARSPVVRLRDGTAVPHFPSHVHRRGRSFGWICETLEGAIHLLITRAIDPRSPEAKWILQDYEDNLFLSNQYGYTLPDFENQWFARGGMSMQACLLLNVEPYLYRDDVKHALRGLFNGMAVSYFPDVRLNTEHALPDLGDWRGDHFKSSDEANAAGWLRYLFVREEGEDLLIGQAVPRNWLRPTRECGLERTSTYFGTTSILYLSGSGEITARLDGPQRNPPKRILLRFRSPDERSPSKVTVDGRRWSKVRGDWVELPGNIGRATIQASYR